jgi:hypothetical protein
MPNSPRGLAEGDEVFSPAPLSNPVVAALKEADLYQEALPSGQHAVLCPWARDHGDRDLGPAIYSEPTALSPVGGFTCPHTHAERPQIGQLLDRLNVDWTKARCKPRIRLLGGEMLRILHASERALSSLGNYYQSGGAIVTIGTSPLGDAVVTIVNDNALTKALAQAADWEKYDGRTKGWRVCDPTPQLVKQLLHAQEYDHLPVLEGVTRQPYFRKSDRALVTQPGYDPTSRIYAVFDRNEFSTPPASRKAAQEALAELKALLVEFHFVSDADRSTTIGAMLTAAARSSLPLAPAFNITASASGSGKSYLAALLAPFAGPAEPLNLSYPTTSEEASKSMLSALISKPAVISFDDMQTDWLPFGMINRMLTSETVADRLLGASRTIQVSTNTFVMGSGNNIGPVRDMCRRVVSISLRPRTEAVATLRYAGRPVEKVRARRGHYVSLALTIIRAWYEADCPRTDVADVATFEAWTDMCRQPLLWLGEPDPAASLIEQIRTDPDAEALGAFLSAWRDLFGAKPVTLRKVADRAESDNGELLDAIMELPMAERGHINRGKFGWFLKRNANRIVEGMHIQKEENSERNAWSVQSIEPVTARPKLPEPIPDVARAWVEPDKPFDPYATVEINGEIY